MGLENSTLLSGATLSATGGTAKTFTGDGVTVANGKHFQDASVADYRERPSLTAKVRQPVYNKSDKSFTKGKKSLTLADPFVDSLGGVQYPLIRIELEDHPEMSEADIDALLNRGAQTLFDSDFVSFWKTGNLA